MKSVWIALFSAGMFTAAATACPPASPREQAADLARQRDRTKDLAGRADIIVAARASVSGAAHAGEFEVLDALKGAPGKTLTLTWADSLTVGCRISDSFQDVHVNQGATYLLYVHAGAILRAGTRERREGEIAFDEEKAIVRKAVAR